MSYAALISLKLTIERLLNSSHISITPHPYIEIECVYKEIGSLQQFLGQISEHKVNVLDRQIRVAICKLENALESHVSNRFLSQSETFGDESYPLNIVITLDLQEVEQEINFFTETVNKMEEEYKMELSKSWLLSEDYDSVSSRIDFGGKKLKMVGLGLQDELTSLIVRFTNEDDPYYLKSVAIVGMAGVGKTTLANLFYEDPSVMNYFDCRVWISAGPKIQLKEVLLGILAQTNPDHFDKNWVEISAKELAKYVYKSLEGKRYLILLDDMWNTRFWSELEMSFPGKSLGNLIVLTTRLEKVAHRVTWPGGFHKKQFLSEEESWYLFNEKVFSKDSCPLEFEKARKKIVENCEGLPLAIIAVGNHLSMAEKTIEYWNKVAEKKVEVFDEEDEKVLYLSYNYLPEHLKACFLYMGVFLHDYEISISKIIMLWSAEGFLEPDARKTIEDIARDCLEDLVSSNLLLVRQRGLSGRIKTCGLHYVFQNLCIKEAEKEKFLHVLKSYASSFTESIKNQRRLCIHNNVLFGFKDVNDSIQSISNAHSLLCFGPHHQYPVPMSFSLRLLRILDALTIRFYNFPSEVVELVHLRYVGFSYDGKLPSSISKLWNLQYLIVRRYQSIIKSSGSLSYLPREIWNMQELRHLQVMGSILPDPRGAILPNLVKILDVSAHSCTKEVLEAVPNLEKLGIQMEYALDGDHKFCCFDHLSHLCALKSLKCVAMVIPNLKSRVVAPPASTKNFPLSLEKLTLSGLGYSWQHMRKIAALPNLKVLKLRNYAFRGSEWTTYQGDFRQVKILVLEDTDLRHWRAKLRPFKALEHLIVRHCYKLEKIPSEIGDKLRGLKSMELVDVKPSLVASAKKMQHRQTLVMASANECFQLRTRSSWEDMELK